MKNRKKQGVVYVETIIVIIPFLILFFGLIQLGLLLAADLLVQHAAAKAARAAIVILPDDSKEAAYSKSPLNKIGKGKGLKAYKKTKKESRYEAIRNAARMVLSPISPALNKGDSVEAALKTNAGSTITGMAVWTKQAVALSFPGAENSYKTTFAPQENISIEITYLYKCSIPIGKELVCKSYSRLDKKLKKLLQIKGSMLPAANLNSNWKFVALQARASLPNQGLR